MALKVGQGFIEIDLRWPAFKTMCAAKGLSMQYVEETAIYYLVALDSTIAYTTQLYRENHPDGPDYSAAQHIADTAQFDASYKALANQPVQDFGARDPRVIRKFGNLTAASVSEVLLCVRPYDEQASEAQRSVQSSSASDTALGVGARKVRITYLTSAYVLKTEDVTLNGTTKVNTVGTDIRFIEKFEVIEGSLPVGAIQLMTGTTGGATEFCGIAIGTETAFLCHHYVPAGKTAWVTGWGVVSDDEVSCKLKTQEIYGSATIEKNTDLYHLRNGNLTPPNLLSFDKKLYGVRAGEKTYVKLTVVPAQATSTAIRGTIYLWEE